ncbi:MAG: response regulator, partial [Candidatus Omnitrophica bacterium]|nr:response regulator [Candidatus Omnitrophota bacterium]
ALCGKAAISWAVEHQPDLVILDLVLPDMDGHKVCQELRRLYSFWALPVLILTAKNQPIDQLRGFAHGADAYMTKPFESGELLRTVALLVGNTAPA